MLYSTVKTNKYGDNQLYFYLTQGDTANFRAVPKLSDDSYKEVFSKEFTKNAEDFTVRLESDETAGIPVGEYIYEVEYTFTDGTVNTPNQAGFEILDQIIE